MQSLSSAATFERVANNGRTIGAIERLPLVGDLAIVRGPGMETEIWSSCKPPSIMLPDPPGRAQP
jgi:hypothetical protein